MAEIRQKLLVLYAHNPSLNSGVGAWAQYDGTGQTRPGTGDGDQPPYPSVVDAMKDGWRVIQFPQQFPAFPGTEYQTHYLKYEFILEKLVEVDASPSENTP